MTLEELQAELDKLDDGILRHGSHNPGREFCALEFESQVRGREWSDNPITLPDIRPINDGEWSSDESRTKHLLPVMVALWDWSTWSFERRNKWIKIITIETVKQIISDLPNLPTEIVEKCKSVENLQQANVAAHSAAAAAAADDAAAYAAAHSAAYVAATYAAVDAANAVAYAAADAATAATAYADSESILITACRIWIDAARESENA